MKSDKAFFEKKSKKETLLASLAQKHCIAPNHCFFGKLIYDKKMGIIADRKKREKIQKAKDKLLRKQSIKLASPKQKRMMDTLKIKYNNKITSLTANNRIECFLKERKKVKAKKKEGFLLFSEDVMF